MRAGSRDERILYCAKQFFHFGGADMRTAYATLSDGGKLAMMQWPEPGLKLAFG